MLPLDSLILLVDDFEALISIQSKMLKDIGYSKIITAKDGVDAFQKLEESPEPVNCIISDWNMPNMDGLELLKKVKADERFKHVPFIMLTSEAEKSGIISAIENGVSNYIIKPATPEILQEKLSKL